LNLSLPPHLIAAGELFQHVSRTIYRGAPLYFGMEGVNRYDDVDRGYGVLYLGGDLSTALMESVFHQHQWHRKTKRSITLTEVYGRMVRAVGAVQVLTLADLTAPGVMVQQLGLNLEQLASRRYKHTQGESKKIHAMADDTGTALFDGLVYPSRNNYPATCIALFERARHKVHVVDDIELADHADWPSFRFELPDPNHRR
jgi:RES domain